ncbi:MAG: restriction endonuclease subunit S [Lachnospiraceae bacterium]|nr:restriction endonuclease subunit S [Lachnospiraceae bacterium]
MKLNIDDWKEFKISSICSIHNGKGITKEEIDDNPGTFPAVQSGEENNGVLGYIDLDYCKSMNYTLSEKPCLTVARSGSAGYVSYQPTGCVVGDSAKILLLKNRQPGKYQYLFLQTILTANRFKYAYGRKVTEEKYGNDIINLPVLRGSDNAPVIDKTHKYSECGYVPDWTFMERYMGALHDKTWEKLKLLFITET